MTTFKKQMDAYIAKYKIKLEAVARTAAQNLLDEANAEGPSVANPDGGRGGRLPVDTGFLLNSIAAAVGSMPSGPSVASDEMGSPDAAAIVIAKLNLGESLYIGWTANYAGRMNVRYGFKDAAEQKWQQYVNQAVAEVNRRIP